MSATELIYNNFNNNRATIEKWLASPRQIQQEYGINPVLAGGAMRDIILGAEVTDLDVFISVSKTRMAAEKDLSYLINKIAEREGWELAHELGEGSGEDGEARHLHSVWTFKSEFVDKPYNFIILPNDSSSQDIINGFDFGINMIAVNNYSIVTANKHFISDVENQRVTVINERSPEVRDRRYAKLLEKYPAIPLVSAEGLELEKPHAGLILPPGVS